MDVPRALLAFLMVIGIFIDGSSVFAAPAGFHGISDDGSERIESTYSCGTNHRCTVSRVIIQRPSYDGPPGYTAVLVTSTPVVGPGVLTEELVVFTRGQVRLLGVDSLTHRVMGYRTAQRGATMAIVHLVAFDSARLEGELVGPQGAYQYVSCSPDGSYCVLVDSGVTMVEMHSGAARKIVVTERIPPSAADPSQETEHGYQIGGGYRTDGEFVEMVWEDAVSGTLWIRHLAGEPMTESAVAWHTHP